MSRALDQPPRNHPERLLPLWPCLPGSSHPGRAVCSPNVAPGGVQLPLAGLWVVARTKGGVGTGLHSPPLKTGTCPDRSWHREASLSLTAALPSLVGAPPGAAPVQGLQDSNFTFCRRAEFQVLETRSLG